MREKSGGRVLGGRAAFLSRACSRRGEEDLIPVHWISNRASRADPRTRAGLSTMRRVLAVTSPNTPNNIGVGACPRIGGRVCRLASFLLGDASHSMTPRSTLTSPASDPGGFDARQAPPSSPCRHSLPQFRLERCLDPSLPALPSRLLRLGTLNGVWTGK